MLGFSDKANLNDSHVRPVYFAATKLTATEETMVRALVKRAIG
jgi:hypothetical protein